MRISFGVNSHRVIEFLEAIPKGHRDQLLGVTTHEDLENLVQHLPPQSEAMESFQGIAPENRGPFIDAVLHRLELARKNGDPLAQSTAEIEV